MPVAFDRHAAGVCLRRVFSTLREGPRRVVARHRQHDRESSALPQRLHVRSMTPQISTPLEAVVICTRNRPDELKKTLESMVGQSGYRNRLVIVVDASDPEEATRTARAVDAASCEEMPTQYQKYEGAPAGTRQRNAGLDLLPASVRFVHFLDDDVRLRSDYFQPLIAALRRHPDVLGVGGIIESPESGPEQPEVSWMHRLFLLSTDTPSQVLPSGQTTPAWPVSDCSLQPADWLPTGASCYRRKVFDNHRFDPKATGQSPRLEDLDFSYRVRSDGPLAVVTGARCVHHRSTRNRRSLGDMVRERTIRRYWFVRKNMDRPLYRAAYWWCLLGRCLAVATSSDPNRNVAFRGLLRGIKTVLTRDHPLLSS